jgi:hypothetical protein
MNCCRIPRKILGNLEFALTKRAARASQPYGVRTGENLGTLVLLKTKRAFPIKIADSRNGCGSNGRGK